MTATTPIRVGSDFESWLTKRLAAVTPPGGARRRRLFEREHGVQVRTSDGRMLLNFAGNDYLGLAVHPGVVAAAKSALERYGAGSGASQLVCGYGPPHRALEQALCELTGRPACALCASGYHANLAVLGVLAGPGDQILMDQLAHASLIDAALLSRARVIRFRHVNLDDLERRLRATPAGRRSIVVTEGVFSMAGDVPPLDELARLCRQHGAVLVVDDAHGFGVLGASGGGVTEHFNLDVEQVPVLIGTFGKALGSAGAFIAGSTTLISLLEQCARTLIYTTALPPASAAAVEAALALVRRADGPRPGLHRRIAHWRARTAAHGLESGTSVTPIQPCRLGSAETAVRYSKALAEQGFLVPAMRPPTVPQGESCLRVSLSALHTDTDLERLAAALAGLA